jgi:hypothetical protein
MIVPPCPAPLESSAVVIASWAVVQWPDTGVVVGAATGAAVVVGEGEVLAGKVLAGEVLAGAVSAGEVLAGAVSAGEVLAGEVLVVVPLPAPAFVGVVLVVVPLPAPAFVGVAWHAASQTTSVTLPAIVHIRVIFKRSAFAHEEMIAIWASFAGPAPRPKPGGFAKAPRHFMARGILTTVFDGKKRTRAQPTGPEVTVTEVPPAMAFQSQGRPGGDPGVIVCGASSPPGWPG